MLNLTDTTYIGPTAISLGEKSTGLGGREVTEVAEYLFMVHNFI